MEFHNEIADCQRIIYTGFTSTQESGIKWLNVSKYSAQKPYRIVNFIYTQDVCLSLTTLCRHLHKFLVFRNETDESVVDTCFLCTNQLIRCVQQLKFTVNVEQEHATVLPTARQHFLDRMLWCLDMLKSIEHNSSIATAADTANFVNYMDIVLELVAPMAIFSCDELDCSNVAAKNAEVSYGNNKKA